MLDIRNIRNDFGDMITRLNIRGLDSKNILEKIIELDDRRKQAQTKIDALLAETNQLNKRIADLYKNKKQDPAKELQEESLLIKKEVQELQDKYKSYNDKILEMLSNIPNTPHISVPLGNNENNNKIIKEVGDIPQLLDDALPHWDLIKKYNLVDFELGNKITGAGFPVYIDRGARLQRALISYFLDKNISAGYVEYLPPHLVNESSGFGTGQLPKFEDDLFKVPSENNLFLIPTAEVPITNLYRNVILKESDFPVKCTAYTPCFRREAGSYGKDVRGLNRLHQFDKVEIVQIDSPQNSYKTLESMVDHIAMILDELNLPYRIIQLCGGDLSFTSALTYDFEVYSAAQKKWLEVSSVSNFESYQANRLKLRYKNDKGENKLCHTLNGSALALPRIFAAIVENNQNQSGSINIPKCLHSYLDFKIIQ
ncbi:MAG: serine--tRNA ligase [Bacteroidota bacterium]|nr:serine--tRNA ligase [Bacteroidota bacterium]